MAYYKNIPVDPDTYEMVKNLAKRNWRGLGAQVRVMAEKELKKEESQDRKNSENELKPTKA